MDTDQAANGHVRTWKGGSIYKVSSSSLAEYFSAQMIRECILFG